MVLEPAKQLLLVARFLLLAVLAVVKTYPLKDSLGNSPIYPSTIFKADRDFFTVGFYF
jgi:hypothetical protein